MQAKILCAAAAAATALVPAGASGSSVSLGGPLSVSCYKSALVRDKRDFAFEGCSRALSEEAMSPDNMAATFVNRGVLHMLRGQQFNAEADFDAAIRLDPASPDPWLNKAFLRLRQGAGSEALPLLDNALERLRGGGREALLPRRAERSPRKVALALFARGIAHEQIGNYRAAHADLVKARNAEPGWKMPAAALERYQVRRR